MNYHINKNIEKYIKKYWRIAVVIMLAVIFFISVSSYNVFIQSDNFVKWSSPDETANYIFAKLYGQTGELAIFEKYNLLVDDIMHPRSFRSDHGMMKPVSFLGIILIFGSMVKITSYKILPYLTPLFGAIGIIYYYLLTKKIFGKKNALISTVLLSVFPVYVYYSARSMFHNILFISLLIAGLYYSYLMVKSKKRYLSFLFASLGGVLVGLAVITRASELLWIAPGLLLLWLFNIRRVGLLKLLLFLGFFIIGILPSLHWNQILYGSYYYGGYPEMNQSIANIASAGTSLVKSTVVGELSYHKVLFNKIKTSVFFFGLSPTQSIKMFFYYFTKMFFWIFWPACIGLILFLQGFHKWKRKHFSYFGFFVISSIILVFYYGSWEFHDNPDPNSFTIGNSYTRYWLPIYLQALPLVSLFIIRFSKEVFSRYKPRQLEFKFSQKINFIKNLITPDKKIFINIFRVLVITSFVLLSLNFVLFGSEEGLVYTAYKNKDAKYESQKVLELTNNGGVIITQYHDKLFFPERKVVLGLFDDPNMNIRYAKLVKNLDVYYYNFTLRPQDIAYLNNGKLKDIGLQIQKIEKITKDFTLYKLDKIILEKL